MITFSLLHGLLLIGLGLLVRRFPDLVSGYNTMSKEKKGNVDIAAIAKVMSRALMWAGLAVMVICITLRCLGLTEYIIYGLIYPLLAALAIASIIVQRHDHNKRSWLERNIAPIIIVVAALIITKGLIQGSTPNVISIEQNKLSIEGGYGTATPLDQIESIELLRTLPKIAARVNGSDTGKYLKGNFRLDDRKYGVCLLYIKPHSAPYIHIKRAEGRDIILNTPDSLTTCLLYDRLLLEQEVKSQNN